MKYAFLCSGNLGFNILSELYNTLDIKFVFTDSKSLSIIDFCKKNDILFFKGNPRGDKAINFIEDNNLNIYKVDILISVNYLFIIQDNIINLASKVAFNVHGSLLPKYRGRTPHVWSIINNEKYTGITAHIIDSGCDTGDIIEQIKIPIESNDTGASLLERYNTLYLPLIKSVIGKIASKAFFLEKQDNKKATYFGKRVPEDGEINWEWQKERIYNWVRAQAYPYPGAFTYLKGKQLVIDEVQLSDFGFDYSYENGSILSTTPLIVKTPNGCLEITKFRGSIENIEINDILKNDNR
ncbi:methionyl-tRNA formyltransferase [uncultured Chryseobacterium sp.]|uniref:methionyl-tRNA formyltransferase n=1 Tax=uncultured Chryseobacterium sp. TaxID=259322 RepID=UPI0025F8BB16|nr:methionyl-tRNA formyltransferase [uncultured Chryseobacterium sp.]